MKPLILVLLSSITAAWSVFAGEFQVASFSPLIAEIAAQVGGNRVEVISLMEPGMDPHQYQPKPSDLKQLAESELVLLSGKHLERYEINLKESVGPEARFVEVGKEIPSLQMQSGEHGHHGDGNEPYYEHAGALIEDPHWWTSVVNVQKATEIIRDAFIEQRPTMARYFRTNASAYIEKLEALRKWVRRKVAELPRDRRKLVTSHDAFRYFAGEYGFTVYSIEGVSTDEDPSNRAIGEIIDMVRAERVKAIFVESTNNPKVAREIIRETGAKLGGMLYADGLGDGDASTYEGMMRHNVITIVDALK